MLDERRVRYGLIVSIRPTNGDVDIYTSVQTLITLSIGIST
ncbi:hypothetical protein [Edaphobacter albus]|nr:hypothetical protein [Edaphobacter sp. 4G125]